MDMKTASMAVANGASAKTWSSDLKQYLDTVDRSESHFATFGVLNKSMLLDPKVTVSGVGTLGLPLTSQALEALKVVATKASFGQGAATLYDESVRQGWQIDAAKVALTGGLVWGKFLRSVVVQSCRELGFSNERIEKLGVQARLHKLLFYEAGGHFAAHCDTEKGVGMFGTLIIQLPSPFTGGAFTVSHEGETKTFVQESDSERDFKYIAFYSDCEHQLHPVTSGVRLCLVFNLACAVSTGPTPAINNGTDTILQSIVGEWMVDKKSNSGLGYEWRRNSVLGYGLGHYYTLQSFGIESLKGRDAVVFQTLLNAKSKNGKPLFEILLLLVDSWGEFVIPQLCLDRKGRNRDYNRNFCKDESTGWYKPFDGYAPYLRSGMNLGPMCDGKVSSQFASYYNAAVVISPFEN
jgi:2OG-Fe(II) oxygenase superfamily